MFYEEAGEKSIYWKLVSSFSLVMQPDDICTLLEMINAL